MSKINERKAKQIQRFCRCNGLAHGYGGIIPSSHVGLNIIPESERRMLVGGRLAQNCYYTNFSAVLYAHRNYVDKAVYPSIPPRIRRACPGANSFLDRGRDFSKFYGANLHAAPLGISF